MKQNNEIKTQTHKATAKMKASLSNIEISIDAIKNQLSLCWESVNSGDYKNEQFEIQLNLVNALHKNMKSQLNELEKARKELNIKNSISNL